MPAYRFLYHARKFLSGVQIFVFLFACLGPLPQAKADDFVLPAPGVMVPLSPEFNPPILKGIKVHPENPFRFDFILDEGDGHLKGPVPMRSWGQAPSDLRQESAKLIKYFLASLTLPEKDLWVNLSPYEENRIIPQSFGLTEMGRDLLAEDYMLKQITASLIYPEGETGKRFWQHIYQEAYKKFGTTNIPVNTFNKVWIVPDKAVVYENAKAGTAYVVEAKLKVMLEQDYLSLEKHQGILVTGTNSWPQKGLKAELVPVTNIVREIVIPELTREVNYDKNFAQLRQVYNSLILATWYKKKIKDSILAQVYVDKDKVKGLSFPNASVGNPQYIYQQYLKAFKKGVFNYIKEEDDPVTQQPIPRKYFSGGTAFSDAAMNAALEFTTREEMLVYPAQDISKDTVITVGMDAAMESGNANPEPTKIRLGSNGKPITWSLIQGPVQEHPAWEKESFYYFANSIGNVGNTDVRALKSMFEKLKQEGVSLPVQGDVLSLGFGNRSIELSDLYKRFKRRTHGVDAIGHRVSGADWYLTWEGYTPDQIVLHHADMNNMKGVIADRSVALVYARGITVQFDTGDLNPALAQEIARVLVPGGIVYIADRGGFVDESDWKSHSPQIRKAVFDWLLANNFMTVTHNYSSGRVGRITAYWEDIKKRFQQGRISFEGVDFSDMTVENLLNDWNGDNILYHGYSAFLVTLQKEGFEIFNDPGVTFARKKITIEDNAQSNKPADRAMGAEYKPLYNFSSLKADEVRDTYDKAKKELREKVDAIRQVPDTDRTFQNTVVAFERALDDFYNLVPGMELFHDVHPTSQVREAYAGIIEDRDNLLDDLYAAPFLLQIFKQIQDRYGPQLSAEDTILLDEFIEELKGHGAHLSDQKRLSIEKIYQQLDLLEAEYWENIREKEGRGFWVNREELSGVPENEINSLVTAKGQYFIPFDGEKYDLLMRYLSREPLRRSYALMYYNSANQNLVILNEIIRLRQQLASTLAPTPGYKSYAHFIFDKNRPESPEEVMQILEQIRGHLKARWEKEAQVLLNLKKADEPSAIQLEEWDHAYYSNLLEKRLGLDEERLKKDFPVNQVIKHTFEFFEKFFAIHIEEISDPQAWYPSVRLFQVIDARNQQPLGQFYLDLYKRSGKHDGFWAYPVRDGYQNADGTRVQPVYVFSASLPGSTRYFYQHQLIKFFHEFGHLLHGVLTKAKYRSQAGMNVSLDFSEFPSQLLEQFAWDPKILEFLSEGKIPAETIDKLLELRRTNMALEYLPLITDSIIDLRLHMEKNSDPDTVFMEEYKESDMPYPEGTHPVALFQHLIEYPASYYAYPFRESDALQAFDIIEAAHFNPSIGLKLRNTILSDGGGKNEAEQLRSFVGEPSHRSFFEFLGLPDGAQAASPADGAMKAGTIDEILANPRLKLSASDINFLKTIHGLVVSGKNGKKYQLTYNLSVSLKTRSSSYARFSEWESESGDIFKISEVDDQGKIVKGGFNIGYLKISPLGQKGYVNNKGRPSILFPSFFLHKEKDRRQEILAGFLRHLPIGTTLRGRDIINEPTLLYMFNEILKENSISAIISADKIEKIRKLVKRESKTGENITFINNLLYDYQKSSGKSSLMFRSLDDIFAQSPLGQALAQGGFNHPRIRFELNEDGLARMFYIAVKERIGENKAVITVAPGPADGAMRSSEDRHILFPGLGKIYGFYLLRGARFGSRYNWVTQKEYSEEGFFHGGMDFAYYVTTPQGRPLAIPEGSEIGSLTDGIAKISKSLSNDNMVTVKAPDGSYIGYFHVMPMVKDGQEVRRGDVIARIAQKYGPPHLHLDVMQDQGDLESLEDAISTASRDEDFEIDPLKLFPGLAINMVAQDDPSLDRKTRNNTQTSGAVDRAMGVSLDDFWVWAQAREGQTLDLTAKQIAIDRKLYEPDVGAILAIFHIRSKGNKNQERPNVSFETILAWAKEHKDQRTGMTLRRIQTTFHVSYQVASVIVRAFHIQTKGKIIVALENQAQNGGIDFTANRVPLQVKLDSRSRGNDNFIKFHLDPAMLKQLQDAPGFVPVIINIQPLRNLKSFLGITA